jgi:ADP-ribosyl-[dinitrogen reductase] hydrolase
MRASPIGLYQKGTTKLEAAAHWARTDATITHKSFEAYEGSAAVAVAVCYLVNGGTKNKLVDTLSKVLKPTRVRFAIEDSWRLIQGGATIRDVLRHHNWEINGVGAHVVATVPAAVSFFLLTPDYATAVTEAVKAGGDTDSTASVTGALAGSHYGYEGIPEELIRGLERADEIRELELALAK